MEINEIAALYRTQPPKTCQVRNIRDEPADFRQVIFVEWPEKAVIKIAGNGFTSPEKVTDWAHLMEQYREDGQYCPRILPTRNGRLAETVSYLGKSVTVWAEEFARFRTADQFPQEIIRDGPRYRYHEEVMESVGRMASRYLKTPVWPSGWCLFRPFSPGDDPGGETMECAKKFKNTIERKFPGYLQRFIPLWNLYLQNKRQLEAIYKALPTSAFQADLNPHNILLDESGHFTGLIDFNLSGRETVLNYVLMEAMWDFAEDADFYAAGGKKRLYDAGLDRIYDESLFRNLKIVGRSYSFSPLEKDAAVLLYRYLRPFSDPIIEELEKAGSDKAKAGKLLGWIEYQLTRDDMDFPGLLS